MGGRLVGVVGPKQAGKDTFAAALVSQHGWARLAFADLLKRYALGVDPWIDVPCDYRGNSPRSELVRLSGVVRARGWDEAKAIPEVRRFLQEAGVAARLYLGGDVWLAPVMRQAEELREHGTSVVVTDVRFPNELQAVRDAGGLLVRITRPRPEDAEDAHASEQLWRTADVDLEYVNTGTVGELWAFASRVSRVSC